MPRYRMVVHGRVQGVGFRWTCLQNAKKNGLTGWVRNRADGAVELEVQGTDEAVATFSAGIRRGNGYSFIDHIEMRPIDAKPLESTFQVLHES